jgi:biotin carboxylase
MKKKILFLVAGDGQLPVIKYARQQGHYIITCDNNPSNVGHLLADEVIPINTYHKEEIFDIIENKGIDAVVNFVSEHGLVTAGYLLEKLQMDGIKPETLSALMDKGKFRELLVNHSFDAPKNKVNTSYFKEIDQGLKYPLIVKPVDRGGSIGITKVTSPNDLSKAFEEAKSKAVSGEVIVEEFIEGTATINGDCVVVNKKIIASLIGDYRYDNEVNPVLPYATTFPTKVNISPIIYQLERLIELIGFNNGALNFEAILSGNSIYFVEINPRHSGNFIYKLMGEAMGINFAHVSVEIALGTRYMVSDFKQTSSYLAYALIYTHEYGILKNVKISPFLNEKIIEKILFINEGDSVSGFKSLHDRIGLLLLRFESENEMDYVVRNIRNFYIISLK